MTEKHTRLLREAQTMDVMLSTYCSERHGGRTSLCPDCQELRTYALERLNRCPFKDQKSTCAKCAVHCYQPAVRERIRVVMRYSGPRMLFRHPVLAVLHMIDGLKRSPALPNRTAAASGKVNGQK